jgi:hypothetical protein
MTKHQPESPYLIPSCFDWSVTAGSSTTVMDKATVMDSIFYPIKHDIVEDTLEPIPVDVDDDIYLTTILDIDDLSCDTDPIPQPDTTKSIIFSSSTFFYETTTQAWENSSSSASTISFTSSSSSSHQALEQQRFKPFHEEKWTIRYKELLIFHNEHHHSAVPHTYPKNPQLARWVKRQRRQYKLLQDNRPSTMTPARLELLNVIGFVWDSHEVNWREKLNSLITYKQAFGDCNVASNHKDKKLATWIKCQRRQHKLYWDGKPSAMSSERIADLEKVGFEWEIRSIGSKSKDSKIAISGHI